MNTRTPCDRKPRAGLITNERCSRVNLLTALRRRWMAALHLVRVRVMVRVRVRVRARIRVRVRVRGVGVGVG